MDVAPSVALCGATVVVALDPPEVVSADVVLAGDRIAAVGAGAGWRDPSRLRGDADPPRQRVRPPPPVLGAEPGDAVPPRPAGDVHRDPPAGLVAPRSRPRRAGDPRLGAARRTRRAARRDHHDRRPPRLAQRHRRLARHHRRRPRRARRAQRALLRGHRPRRARAGRGRHRREPSLPRPLATGWRGGWWARTRRSRSPTTRWPSCVDAARLGGVGVHIHVAEDAADQRRRRGAVRSRRSSSGSTGPGVLTDQALLAHCVHVAPTEVQRSSSTPVRRSCATRAAT